MGFLNHSGFDEDSYLNDDDGPMFGGSDRYEQRKERLERAKEIASGITHGRHDDDETHELAQKIAESDG